MMTTDNKNGKIVKPAGAVVVLGSLHYDVMVETSRRPEKGETVTGKRWYPKFGGKGGNQAVAAKLHGAQVRFVSATGSDNFADYLHERLTQVGISREYVPRIQSVETGMSVAIQDSDGDYGAVIVSGANLAIEPEILSDESLWLDSSILLLQNEVPESLNLIAAKQARYRNIPVCLNAAPVRQMSSDLANLIDILVVNAVEAHALGGRDINSLDAAARTAKQLSARFPTVVVTAGGDGVAVYSRNGSSINLSAKEINVVSTHGAGDVFTGTLCAEIAAGTTLHQAVEVANERAGIHVAS
ncbi:MAG: ribokinase [Porticoccaceae bacterium]|jgi:ribokinase